MKEIDVNLSNLKIINSFLNDISKFKEGLFIKSESNITNAKSPIGILACDLSKPIKIIIDSEENEILPVLERYAAA